MLKDIQNDQVYEKLSQTFKVKFKSQIKNNPIQFERLLFINNLVSDEKFYLLEIAKINQFIKFYDRESLVVEFLKYIDYRIIKNKNDFEDLNERELNIASCGVKYDENQIYLEHEVIGSDLQKLDKLKKKLLSFSSK